MIFKKYCYFWILMVILCFIFTKSLLCYCKLFQLILSSNSHIMFFLAQLMIFIWILSFCHNVYRNTTFKLLIAHVYVYLQFLTPCVQYLFPNAVLTHDSFIGANFRQHGLSPNTCPIPICMVSCSLHFMCTSDTWQNNYNLTTVLSTLHCMCLPYKIY